MQSPDTYAGNLSRRIMLAITRKISSDINVHDFRAIHDAILNTLEKEFPSSKKQEQTRVISPQEVKSFLPDEEIKHVQNIWRTRRH